MTSSTHFRTQEWMLTGGGGWKDRVIKMTLVQSIFPVNLSEISCQKLPYVTFTPTGLERHLILIVDLEASFTPKLPLTDALQWNTGKWNYHESNSVGRFASEGILNYWTKRVLDSLIFCFVRQQYAKRFWVQPFVLPNRLKFWVLVKYPSCSLGSENTDQVCSTPGMLNLTYKADKVIGTL